MLDGVVVTEMAVGEEGCVFITAEQRFPFLRYLISLSDVMHGGKTNFDTLIEFGQVELVCSDLLVTSSVVPFLDAPLDLNAQ